MFIVSHVTLIRKAKVDCHDLGINLETGFKRKRAQAVFSRLKFATCFDSVPAEELQQRTKPGKCSYTVKPDMYTKRNLFFLTDRHHIRLNL